MLHWLTEFCLLHFQLTDCGEGAGSQDWNSGHVASSPVKCRLVMGGKGPAGRSYHLHCTVCSPPLFSLFLSTDGSSPRQPHEVPPVAPTFCLTPPSSPFSSVRRSGFMAAKQFLSAATGSYASRLHQSCGCLISSLPFTPMAFPSASPAHLTLESVSHYSCPKPWSRASYPDSLGRHLSIPLVLIDQTLI